MIKTDDIIAADVNFKAGEYARAEAAYGALDRSAASDLSVEQKAYVLTQQAACQYLQGRTDEARATLQEALTVNPDYALALAYRLYIKAETGISPEEKEITQLRGIALSKGDTAALLLVNLADAYCEEATARTLSGSKKDRIAALTAVFDRLMGLSSGFGFHFGKKSCTTLERKLSEMGQLRKSLGDKKAPAEISMPYGVTVNFDEIRDRTARDERMARELAAEEAREMHARHARAARDAAEAEHRRRAQATVAGHSAVPTSNVERLDADDDTGEEGLFGLMAAGSSGASSSGRRNLHLGSAPMASVPAPAPAVQLSSAVGHPAVPSTSPALFRQPVAASSRAPAASAPAAHDGRRVVSLDMVSPLVGSAAQSSAAPAPAPAVSANSAGLMSGTRTRASRKRVGDELPTQSMKRV